MDSNDLVKLITEQLEVFYTRRIEKLNTLKLKHVLRRKNPYLFKAIGKHNAIEIIDAILSAFLSSSDETIFGDVFFEPIAKAVSGGVVSPSKGVDIAIEEENRYLAIAVKSGPYPYNSSQKEKQNQEFMELRSRLLKIKKQFDAMLGHCYGRTRSDSSKEKIYRDRSGQEFWEELTGDPGFYIKLINSMEQELIKEHVREYQLAWDRAINRYVGQFINDFCDEDGTVDWEKLLAFNSGKR